MAKISEAEKAKNKQHRRERDQAFRNRLREYNNAMEKAVSEFEQTSPLKVKAAEASQICDAAMQAREDERRDLQTQIAALQKKIEGLSDKHNIEHLNNIRRSTNTEFHQAKKQVEDAVDAQFKDIAGIFSAVQWEANLNQSSKDCD